MMHCLSSHFLRPGPPVHLLTPFAHSYTKNKGDGPTSLRVRRGEGHLVGIGDMAVLADNGSSAEVKTGNGLWGAGCVLAGERCVGM